MEKKSRNCLLTLLESTTLRAIEAEKALKELLFAYINKDEDCPHAFEVSAVAQAKKILGE